MDGLEYRRISQEFGVSVESTGKLAKAGSLLGDMPFRAIIENLMHNRLYSKIMPLAGSEAFHFLGPAAINTAVRFYMSLFAISRSSAIRVACTAAGRLSTSSGIKCNRKGRDFVIEISNSVFVPDAPSECQACGFYCGFIEEASAHLTSASISITETACASVTGGTICYLAASIK